MSLEGAAFDLISRLLEKSSFTFPRFPLSFFLSRSDVFIGRDVVRQRGGVLISKKLLVCGGREPTEPVNSMIINAYKELEN